MKKINNKVFLYSGLALLLIAFIIRWAEIGIPYYLFWIVFGMGILLKAAFLVNTFRVKDLKFSLGLYFIIAGVILIFLSLVFKYIYPAVLIRNILFYGAITLKIMGLALLLIQKKL